jgi:hypothetical protein
MAAIAAGLPYVWRTPREMYCELTDTVRITRPS